MMAYISYDKLWKSEFCNDVPATDRVKDIILDQMKLKVNDTYKKDEKITTNFETFDDSDVINKAFLVTK